MTARWLIPLGAWLALAGYFGPWIGHPVAGLVITGLDLGEYVKFLPPVRSGAVWLWRPGFYAPLVAVSAGCILAAFRQELGYRWWMRAALLAAALAAALNLLPPAWTPARLLEPEFRWQMAALAGLLAALLISPFLALLPRRLAAAAVTLLALAGLIFPAQGFFAVLPTIAELYNRPLRPAWGLWLMLTGLLVYAGAFWLPHAAPRAPATAPLRPARTEPSAD
ncbi:MAG TPA: hypothetical protein VNK95_12360 [Caldilineaceae bacterium]|nr:hypothetical protein [Caldilineaceae bacterium]